MREEKACKIGFFVPVLAGGGAERIILTLAGGFADRGFNVDLILAQKKGPYLREVPEKVRIVDLGAGYPMLTIRIIWGLVNYLKTEKPNCLLSTLTQANILALWSKRISGIPTRVFVREANTLSIASANAESFRGRIMPFLAKQFYPWAEGIVTLSKGVAEDLIRLIDLPREQVYPIYNPVVTPDLFLRAEEVIEHPWFVNRSTPVVLAAGRLIKQKDFPTLIRAFAQVHNVISARLIILGEGKERVVLERLIRSLGLSEVVSLPGFVENPFKYMKHADVFVLSSAWEGLGNVSIQALALGTPVISTDCPYGPSEILEGGKWGTLVPVGDAKAMADEIIDILQSPKVLHSEEAVDRFQLEKVVDQYLALMLGDKR